MHPCPHCDYALGPLEPDRGTVVCPDCRKKYKIPWLPLFVITGGGGCGKTSVAEALVGRLDSCLIVEADLFRPIRKTSDSKQAFWDYLIFLCLALSRNGRPAVLCGWVNPSQVQSSPRAKFFSAVHSLVLGCEASVQTARLGGRYPKHRKNPPTAEGIEEALSATRIMKEEAETYPNVTVLDTTTLTLDQTVSASERWILERLDT